MMLHLMILSKTTEEYIKFLKNNFDIKKHKIILWSGDNAHNVQLEKNDNIKILKNKKDLFVFHLKFWKLRKYDKIIIHGWYYPYLSIPILLNKILLKKIYWCIWGADSQVLFERKKGLLSTVYYYIDRFCKKRVRAYITHIEEEYKLVKENLNTKGEYINSFMYPGNMHKEIKIENIKNKKKGLYIQIGNSAEERNHLEILDILRNNNEKIERIYLPLAYGDSNNYVRELLKKIPLEFKNKVYPITKVVPYAEYLDFLNNIDIAIFPFKRQQAFGNIITLLGMGKTVYLNSESLTYNCLKRLNINVEDINNLVEIQILSNFKILDNIKKISNIFSKKKLIDEWLYIFKE